MIETYSDQTELPQGDDGKVQDLERKAGKGVSGSAAASRGMMYQTGYALRKHLLRTVRDDVNIYHHSLDDVDYVA